MTSFKHWPLNINILLVCWVIRLFQVVFGWQEQKKIPPSFLCFWGNIFAFQGILCTGAKKKKTFKAVCVFVCAKINWYTSAAVVTRGIRGKVLEKAWFFDLRATVFCPLDFQTVVNSRYQKKARHRVDKDSDVPAGKFPGRQQRVPFKNRGRFKVFCFSSV